MNSIVLGALIAAVAAALSAALPAWLSYRESSKRREADNRNADRQDERQREAAEASRLAERESVFSTYSSALTSCIMWSLSRGHIKYPVPENLILGLASATGPALVEGKLETVRAIEEANERATGSMNAAAGGESDGPYDYSSYAEVFAAIRKETSVASGSGFQSRTDGVTLRQARK